MIFALNDEKPAQLNIFTHPEDKVEDEEGVLDAKLPAAQSRHLVAVVLLPRLTN